MTRQMQAFIIMMTWIILLALYLVNRFLVKSRFLKHLIVVRVEKQPDQDSRPGSFLSKAGVLFVFIVNIISMILTLVLAFTPLADGHLGPLRVELPLWVNVAGSVLFVLYSTWGLSVLLFNPNYTPLYRNLRNQYVVAIEGPYSVVRHPRYSAEALFNIILFLFTGIWIPLLGIGGWPAIYHQARSEEALLTTLAGKEYEEYYRNTGMFLPRLKR